MSYLRRTAAATFGVGLVSTGAYLAYRRPTMPALSPVTEHRAASQPALSPAVRPSLPTVTQAVHQNTFSHVTRTEHVPSIMQYGLTANRGGQGGASEAIGSSRFMRRSQGHVHLGSNDPAQHITNSPDEFYTNVYRGQGIPSTTLTIARPPGMNMHPDPDDRQGGRYRTTQDIAPSSIVPMRLASAFRPAGTIGADYSPATFTRQAMGTAGHGRSDIQRTEDMRRAVHQSNATIYTEE